MTRLGRIAVPALVASAFMSPAVAADLPPAVPVYKAPAVVPYVAPLWSGAYWGLQAGYGWGRSDLELISGPSSRADVNGALAGGTLGYNFRAGAVVYGIEGDVSYGWMKGNNTGLPPCAGCEVENDWQATIRGRIGYAFGSFLPYVTGGVAFGGVVVSDLLGGREDNNKVGWTVGAGFEQAINSRWSAKLEYLYVDLGKTTVALGLMDVSFHANIVRAGINARF